MKVIFLAASKNRFLDDSQIIISNVKPDPQPKEDISNQPKDSISEVSSKMDQIVTEVNAEVKPQVNVEVKTEVNTEVNTEQSIVQNNDIKIQMPDPKTDLKQMLQNTYKKPDFPVYSISKNYNTGQLIVGPKSNVTNEVIPEIPIQQVALPVLTDKQKAMIPNLIDKADTEILLRTIELAILSQLIAEESDGNIRSSYNNKVISLKRDLDSLEKRKAILEKLQ